MAAFFALPFGSTGHAHAAHNGFTINYGGRQLFGGTGYYSNFNDKHTLMHYRSRGHNTILADGLAQVIGENGYGWLARFAEWKNRRWPARPKTASAIRASRASAVISSS